MGITDAIHQSATDLIDALAFYYESDMQEIAEDPDIIEIVAVHLKVYERKCIFKPTQAKDWTTEAKIFIQKYIKDNYCSEDEDSESD
jgi:hypothetical protein